jgi:hypothetical protein
MKWPSFGLLLPAKAFRCCAVMLVSMLLMPPMAGGPVE